MEHDGLSPPGPRLARFPSVTTTTHRASIASDGWPCSPLLPTTPTANAFPRSSSGQSIPIFFQPEDVVGGSGDEEDSLSEGDDSDGFHREPRPNQTRTHFDSDLDRLSSYSSSISSRCLSIDSSSVASDSTAQTDPPSPLPLSPQHDKSRQSPPSFAVPLPLPAPHVRSVSHVPLLNARRNVGSRPGTAPSLSSPPRQRSVTYAPTSSSVTTPRAYHSHQCTKRRSPPRSAPPPADAFFDPFSSSRPSTASTFGSVKAIPIRLVPPTPTDDERTKRAPPRQLYHASSASPVQAVRTSPTKEARSKPLPSLPIFPTRPRCPTATTESPRKCSPPSTAVTHGRNRSRSEGVYNVPVYPPCVYPPSPPRPAPSPSFRSSPRSTVPHKFSFRTLRGLCPDDVDADREPLIERFVDLPTPPAFLSDLRSSRERSEVGPSFVPGESTLQLLIDQEGFRDAKVEFVYAGEDTETGLLEFKAKRPEAGIERDGWPFHTGFLQTPPHLRRLHVNGDNSIDYLSREASLAIGKKDGVYKVSSHSKVDIDSMQDGHGDVAVKGLENYFCFAYETRERLNLVGRPMKGERLLRPLAFVCSRSFLSPSQGHKIGFKHLLSRTFALSSSSALVVKKR
ncbi:hypothetical protein JCM10212_005880 [Sporobolomyces blumeae]